MPDNRIALQEIERLQNELKSLRIAQQDIVAYNRELERDIGTLIRTLNQYAPGRKTFDGALSDFTLRELTK